MSRRELKKTIQYKRQTNNSALAFNVSRNNVISMTFERRTKYSQSGSSNRQLLPVDSEFSAHSMRSLVAYEYQARLVKGRDLRLKSWQDRRMAW